VIPVANSTRRRQCQYAFVDSRGSAAFASTWTTNRRFSFYRSAACGVGRKNRQLRVESLLHALSIGCS
jgi:hypothetical protein